MFAAVVWMDHEHAKIFRLLKGKMESEQVKNTYLHDAKAEKKVDKFFHEVAKHLNGASEILLMGPGIAKQEFLHHLKHHHHESLAEKVVGVETVDHPSDAQILDKAHGFFKKFDLFYA